MLFLCIGLGLFAAALIGVIIGLGHQSIKENKEGRLKELEYQTKLIETSHDTEKGKDLENRIIELNQRIEDKQVELKKLVDEKNHFEYDNTTLSVFYGALNTTIHSTQKELVELEREKNEVLAEQNKLQEAILDSKTALSSNIREIKILDGELNSLKERKRLAILNQESLKEGGWEFSINPKENELISILERIKLDYVDLKGDISFIEGKKIGLPKIQDLSNEMGLDRKTGIYRLILKSDENVCYVGQAQSIKDRGYQHIKKMIGVDAKGSEKLYNYRPEDFYWTVVEENPVDINAAEKYGIEYFGCKEKGLNKKL